MLSLSQPHPLHAIVASVDARTPLGSVMRTVEWEAMPAGLRDAAFFSASVESTRWLQMAKDGIAEIIGRARAVNDKGESYWKMDRARLMADLRRYGESIALQRPGGREGGKIREADIKDPLSIARLRLIIETQMELAYGKADWLTGMDPDILAAFPAWELVRISARMVPRDWPARWKAAGGELRDGGRMIALKTDPIWKALSRFGNPHPPFDFNSGMGVEDIDRAEAEELGLLGPDDELTPNVTNHEEALEASLKGISEPLQKDLRQRLIMEVADARGAMVPNGVQLVQEDGGVSIRLSAPRSTTVMQPGAWRQLQALMPAIQRADLRALAGARESSSLEVKLDDRGRVVLDARDSDRSASRSISVDGDGSLFVFNASFFLRPESRGRHEGAFMLLRQAEAAQRLGAAYLRAYAVQSSSGGVNGAVVWPRYGYDGALPARLADRVEAELGHQVETVQDLLELPGGIDWWDANAESLNLIFDLSPGSRSFNLLHGYFAQRQPGAPNGGDAA